MCREAFPVLNEIGARLVPEREAKARGIIGPDDSYTDATPDLDPLRKELIVLARAFGETESVGGIDLRWIKSATATIAEQALGGICDFDYATESNPDALKAVIEATRTLLKERKVSASADGPF